MREKSGVSNGSVLGLAKGLDAGSVAVAVVEVLALRAAASAGAVVTTARAAVASRSWRIMSLLENSIMSMMCLSNRLAPYASLNDEA